MSDVAEQVLRWHQSGRPVTVARLVDVRGISSHDRSHLLAATPGEPPAGRLLAGAADDQLAAELAAPAPDARLVEVRVDDAAAARSGFSCGGVARLIVSPSTDIPAVAWQAIATREPVCLVTALDGESPGGTEVFTRATADGIDPRAARLFARGTSESTVVDELAITTVWPTPTLVVVGDGLIADALGAQAALLGWSTSVVNDADSARDAVAGLSSADGAVVLSHSRDVDGPALTAALAGRVGYIGALGARHTQAARTAWLAERGVTDLRRVHGPAGLDVGAYTPAEIAVAIVAEMLAARSGRTPGSLRDRSGPVHADALHAPPPRYSV